MSTKDIDNYIKKFPPSVQDRLENIRFAIKTLVPDGEEVIKYGMPTFVFNGNLVHFAAFKNHIGFYPTPSATGAFKQELSVYKSGKGSAQFPHDKPLPLELIKKIVKFRLAENLKRPKPKSYK